ncbi:MAG TPA: hypothetical protein VGZ27_05260 [Vicinamibacterales bacterium]|jgi:hypothetical protein|nr:hypothetical protein [Vicinamibacterales bacterium]
MKFYLTGALALVLACAAVQDTQARKEDELITLTGCVQGFAQGGYFLSDSTDKNGKPKHYLLVNDNDEVRAFTGKWVEVAGRPSDFSWGVKITTADNRTLKTGSVFGVDTVKLVRDSCSNGAGATTGTVASR